ncbi:hypothetical protein [uncultured Lutibacter sp.]|uniref:hypothetical protein n=1 Tax=uncultured Lutibacter sp. TaxID=437739 RepID=UPI002639EC8D|nr:hypothetical protein [uncultured Lutibacter sp.]
MSSEIIKTTLFLDELLEVFFHKVIYYVPSDIVGDVKEQLKDQIDDDFYDAFYFMDNKLGSGIFTNENAYEVNSYLIGKRTFLEQNTFKLVEKSKELTEFEFLVIIEKYYEYLMLFIDITQWLSENVKKYNGDDVHISIIGAFHMQCQFYVTHLKDICNYFGLCLDLEKDFNFTVGQFVLQYLPDLISRYAKIEEAQEEVEIEVKRDSEDIDTVKEKSNQITKIPKPKKKKQRPKLDDKKVELMILKKVFNLQ